MEPSGGLCSLAGVALIAAALGACVGGGDLGRDAFVGDWRCGEETVTLTRTTIQTSDGTEKIAWIETDMNADFGLFTTRGARYSIYDQERNSLTLYAHESRTSRACRRT